MNMTFDYAGNMISPDDEATLEACASRVIESREVAVHNFMAVASAIAAAHELFAHRGNGCFESWCKSRLQMSPRQARNLLNVNKSFGESEIDFRNFDCGSLLLLADEEVGDDLRQKIIDAGNSGTPITQAVVKGVLLAYEKCDDPDVAAAITDEILRRSADGERITKRVFREVAKSHGIEDEPETPLEVRMELNQAVIKTRQDIERCIQHFPLRERSMLAEILRQYATQLEEEGFPDGGHGREGASVALAG